MGIGFIELLVLIVFAALGIKIVFAIRSHFIGPGFPSRRIATHRGWMPFAAVATVLTIVFGLFFVRSTKYESNVQIGRAIKSTTTTSTSVQPVIQQLTQNRDLLLQQLAREHALYDMQMQSAEHAWQIRESSQQPLNEQQRSAERRQFEASLQAAERTWRRREAELQIQVQQLQNRIAQNFRSGQQVIASSPEPNHSSKSVATTTASIPNRSGSAPTNPPSQAFPMAVQAGPSGAYRIRSRGLVEKPPAWVKDPADRNQDDLSSDTVASSNRWSHPIDRQRFPTSGSFEEVAVSSGWFATEEEALDQLTSRSLDMFEQLYRERSGNSLPLGARSSVFLEQNSVRECQIERTMKDFGKNIREPMYRAHAWLKIDVSQSSPTVQLARAHLQESRILMLGFFASCITFCLGTIGQCIRWNIQSEGRYRRSLTALASLVVLAAATGVMVLTVK